MEVCVEVRSLPEWVGFLEANPTFMNQSWIEKFARQIGKAGFREPLTGRMATPSQITVGASWREGLCFEGVASRVRAVMLVIEQIINLQGLQSPRIYAAEGLTNFALKMRGLFPRFLGSEFTLDQERREWAFPIPCEDLQKLTLPTECFDIVSTNEVLEHVPSIDKALGELCRILKPGGWHVGTIPFAYFDNHSEPRAILNEQNEVVHLKEPEYHGDPMNHRGVLVFEYPAWDILDRARRAGFREAFMRLVISKEAGIVSEHIGGVLVFCCQK